MDRIAVASADTLRLLDAVSDPVRMQILFLLCGRGRLQVGAIASHFHLSRPAISHHLKVLKDARVLGSEKAGQAIYYWAERASIVAALRLLADAVESCCPERPRSEG